MLNILTEFIFQNKAIIDVVKYTSQQKKRYKDFLKCILMLKPKQLFIIIYVNVFVKRDYPHKTNNTIMFRYGKIPEN